MLISGVKAKAKLRTLSGGMLRRVGIAQAIVNDPDLLLLDEPTAGLDPEQRVQFRVLLRSLGETVTVMVSTHLVEDVGAGILVLARDVVGFTGIGLLCSLVTGALLAWTLPMGYMLFCQYALPQSWTAPWTWPVRPPADRGAWLWAGAVFAVGLHLFTIRGPRARLTDDS